MYSLYIDTHYVELVLALFRDGELLCKKEFESNKHSENTVSLLNELLTENNITVNDLNEVIVINGPGSFTGVRIGVVIAKMIGYCKNINIKSLSYLEAMALNYQECIVGLKDRNGIFIGEFDKDHNLINDYYYPDSWGDFKKVLKQLKDPAVKERFETIITKY